MIIADRMESLTRYYDRWMNLITGDRTDEFETHILGYLYQGSTPVIYWKRVWR